MKCSNLSGFVPISAVGCVVRKPRRSLLSWNENANELNGTKPIDSYFRKRYNGYKYAVPAQRRSDCASMKGVNT